MTDTNTRAPSVKSEAKSEARNESEKSTQIKNVSGNNSTPTLESHEKTPTMTKSNKKNKKEVGILFVSFDRIFNWAIIFKRNL